MASAKRLSTASFLLGKELNHSPKGIGFISQTPSPSEFSLEA